MGLRQEPGTSQLVVDNMIVVTQLFDGLSIMCKDTNWSMFRGVQYTSKYYPVTLAGGFHCIVEYIVVSGSLPATSTGADTVHIRFPPVRAKIEEERAGNTAATVQWVSCFHMVSPIVPLFENQKIYGMRWDEMNYMKPW